MSKVASISLGSPFMETPQVGDIIVRAAGAGYELVAAVSGRHLAGPFMEWEVAIARAGDLCTQRIWQQNVDNRGRPLGAPVCLNESTVYQTRNM